MPSSPRVRSKGFIRKIQKKEEYKKMNKEEKEIWEKGYDKGYKIGLNCALGDLKNLISVYKKIIEVKL